MKNLEKQQKCTMYNVQCTTNDERQERKDNGNIDSVSERYRSHGMTGGTEKWPTKSARNDGHSSVIPESRNRESMINKTPLSRAAFTLVELVITIAIVIILSVISVPIYRGYVDKAKWSEGYALLGTILAAQKAYYSEYGNFYIRNEAWSNWTSYENALGIDARGNKYFSLFTPSSSGNLGYLFAARATIPTDLIVDNRTCIRLVYNITEGFVVWGSDKDEEIH